MRGGGGGRGGGGQQGRGRCCLWIFARKQDTKQGFPGAFLQKTIFFTRPLMSRKCSRSSCIWNREHAELQSIDQYIKTNHSIAKYRSSFFVNHTHNIFIMHLTTMLNYAKTQTKIKLQKQPLSAFCSLRYFKGDTHFMDTS